MVAFSPSQLCRTIRRLRLVATACCVSGAWRAAAAPVCSWAVSSSAAVSPSILSLCTVEDRSCVLSGSSTGVVSQWDMNTAQIVGDAHGRGKRRVVVARPEHTSMLRSESF